MNAYLIDGALFGQIKSFALLLVTSMSLLAWARAPRSSYDEQAEIADKLAIERTPEPCHHLD
jgi:hypothetical protein